MHIVLKFMTLLQIINMFGLFPAFGKRVSSVYTASPKGLDESGVFKVPAVPPTKTPVKSATPAFTIYSDDDSVLPTPVPTPTPVQPFQIYEDDSDTQAKPVDPPSAELPTASLPFNPPQPPTSKYAEASPSTMKMLNFQSDDSDSGGEEELVYRRKEPVAPLKVAQVPAIAVTQPTPAKEAYVPQTYEPTPVPFNGYHYEVKCRRSKLVFRFLLLYNKNIGLKAEENYKYGTRGLLEFTGHFQSFLC